MSEIENKKNSVFIWISLIIISIIIWILVDYFNFSKKEDKIAIIPDSLSMYNQAVRDSNLNIKINDFIHFTEDSSRSNNIINYSKEGLHKLSAALNFVIKSNDTLRINLGLKQK